MEDLVYDGVRTSSPGQLTLLLTENFKQWFQAKPGEKDRDWGRVLENETLFRQLADSRGIKEGHTIDALWKSIAKRPDSNKLQKNPRGCTSDTYGSRIFKAGGAIISGLSRGNLAALLLHA